ncbi:MAG: site-2 protease family protein, partial [Candidatus Binatia bacterium]
MTLESIAAAIGVLALVILVHELGHFLVAKRCNTEVQVFSIGFGPKLFSFVRGETEYRISLIPVGGYVRMAGELEEFAPKVPGRGFPERPLAQRSAIVAAGPAVNLLFAFV